jgi:hypothetical protein
LTDTISGCHKFGYSNYSIEDTAFIVRSNKRANQYNEQIRTKILDKESELSTGDFLMVVKNIILA